jgi:phosphoribosyl-ATP pyrophosphohydrolase/phosphoribosyl-AMP cyclohydrolase
VVDVRLDCDGDAVLYRVRQSGPACHTGTRSCFAQRLEEGTWSPAADGRHVLHRIEQVVRERDERRPPGAYTTYLLEKGVDKILKKIGEESTEVVIAAKNDSAAELRAETADLLFHLLVLLRARSLPLGEIWDELDTRFSGREQTPHPE